MSVCNLSGSTSFTVAAKVLADEDLANEDDGPLEEEANDVEHREAAGKDTVVQRTAAFRFNIARLWLSATATMRMNKTRPAGEVRMCSMSVSSVPAKSWGHVKPSNTALTATALQRPVSAVGADTAANFGRCAQRTRTS